MPNKQGNDEKRLEIESLFKAVSVADVHQIKPHGILTGLQSQTGFHDQVLRRELEFVHKKTKMILPSQAAPPAGPHDDSK